MATKAAFVLALVLGACSKHATEGLEGTWLSSSVSCETYQAGRAIAANELIPSSRLVISKDSLVIEQDKDSCRVRRKAALKREQNKLTASQWETIEDTCSKKRYETTQMPMNFDIELSGKTLKLRSSNTGGIGCGVLVKQASL